MKVNKNKTILLFVFQVEDLQYVVHNEHDHLNYYQLQSK